MIIDNRGYDPNRANAPEPKAIFGLVWAKEITTEIHRCLRCGKEATMICETEDEVTNASRYGTYCKEHYETLFEDLLAEAAELVEDYDEDE